MPPWLGWAVEVLGLCVAVHDAGERPRPLCARGRWALAMAVAGKSVASSSWAKNVVAVASWWFEKWRVVSGGSSRRR